LVTEPIESVFVFISLVLVAILVVLLEIISLSSADAADTEATRIRGLIATNSTAIGAVTTDGVGSGIQKALFDRKF
jgi:hypothetical protein